jgi:cell envelope opacity-associated protein A
VVEAVVEAVPVVAEPEATPADESVVAPAVAAEAPAAVEAAPAQDATEVEQAQQGLGDVLRSWVRFVLELWQRWTGEGAPPPPRA